MSKAFEPPTAAVHPHEIVTHSDSRIDNYFWLSERQDDRVITYLEAENAYTGGVMESTAALQQTLYDEMLGRIKETDMTVPVKIDDFYYYSRTEEGKQYPIYCRKFNDLQADEEILLDQNELAAEHDYYELGVFRVSPDHKILAYSYDDKGDELYTLMFKNLATGELFDESISGTYYSLAWTNDSKTVFYVTVDDAKRPYRLLKHKLGTPASADPTIYNEDDEAFLLHVSKSKSKAYIFMGLSSKTSSEYWFLDADQPETRFSVIQTREQNHEYSVAHHANYFYIVSNQDARNFRLLRTETTAPGKQHWREVMPYNPDIKLDAVECFRNHLVLYERQAGLTQIRIMNPGDASINKIEFEEAVYSLYGMRNPTYDTSKLRFWYNSMITPDSIYEYDMASGLRELLKRKEVPGGYNRDDYISERIFANADDGTRIPISIVYRKDNDKSAQPLLLYGYGAYGVSIEPDFNPNKFSLLDRGFIFAIAHIRGGGEMGRQWYEDGKLLHKRNTFTDFISCAQHLIKLGYTCAGKLAINGGSAGGLLMGAVVNMRPDLFQAVLAKVPFVDVLNTMLDDSIPLTVTEYDEWGNPHEQAYYDYIKSYSPYDNISRQPYPHMLITAGLHDPRVQYWEPAKWIAKLRTHTTGDKTMLLKTNMTVGHGGASGRYDYLREIAFEYAFILKAMQNSL